MSRRLFSSASNIGKSCLPREYIPPYSGFMQPFCSTSNWTISREDVPNFEKLVKTPSPAARYVQHEISVHDDSFAMDLVIEGVKYNVGSFSTQKECSSYMKYLVEIMNESIVSFDELTVTPDLFYGWSVLGVPNIRAFERQLSPFHRMLLSPSLFQELTTYDTVGEPLKYLEGDRYRRNIQFGDIITHTGEYRSDELSEYANAIATDYSLALSLKMLQFANVPVTNHNLAVLRELRKAKFENLDVLSSNYAAKLRAWSLDSEDENGCLPTAPLPASFEALFQSGPSEFDRILSSEVFAAVGKVGARGLTEKQSRNFQLSVPIRSFEEDLYSLEELPEGNVDEESAELPPASSESETPSTDVLAIHGLAPTPDTELRLGFPPLRSSRFRGVYKESVEASWEPLLLYQGSLCSGGFFAEEELESAARAFDALARMYYGSSRPLEVRAPAADTSGVRSSAGEAQLTQEYESELGLNFEADVFAAWTPPEEDALTTEIPVIPGQPLSVEELVDALRREHALDINAISLPPQFGGMFDHVVLCTAKSEQHMRRLADMVCSALRKRRIPGLHLPTVEGRDTEDWMVVDCGNIMFSVQDAVSREAFALDEVWEAQARGEDLYEGLSYEEFLEKYPVPEIWTARLEKDKEELAEKKKLVAAAPTGPARFNIGDKLMRKKEKSKQRETKRR